MPYNLTKANLNIIATPTPTITLFKAITLDISPSLLDDDNFKINYNKIDCQQPN